MPDLKPLPSPFRPGSSQLSARSLNEMRDSAVQQMTGTDGISVSKIGRRIILTPNGEETIADNELRTFSIVGIDYDILTCVIYDYTGVFFYDATLGSAIPTDQYVYITKPSLLQKSPWDGITVTIDGVDYTYAYGTLGTRTNTSSLGPVLDETISPDYFIGEIIVARQSYTGYTDVHSNPIMWEDINEAGRTWTTPASSSATPPSPPDWSIQWNNPGTPDTFGGDSNLIYKNPVLTLTSLTGQGLIHLGQDQISTPNPIADFATTVSGTQTFFVGLCSNAGNPYGVLAQTNGGSSANSLIGSLCWLGGVAGFFSRTLSSVTRSITVLSTTTGIVDTGLTANSVVMTNSIKELVTPGPQTVTGSRASGAALVSLLSALATLGLITDSTTT